jgi:hypothetical protein
VIISLESIAGKHNILSSTLTSRFFFFTPGLSFFEWVEVSCIILIFELWYVRCFLLSDPLPVNARKKRMGFYFLNSVNSEPFSLIVDESPTLRQILPDKITSSIAKVCLLWYDQMLAPILNFVPRHTGLLRDKRWIAYKHFIQNDTHRPPVHYLSVAGCISIKVTFSLNFRSNIIGRTNCRIC